jgi:hypothetical protein
MELSDDDVNVGKPLPPVEWKGGTPWTPRLTPSLAEIDALEARVKELEQLVRDFAGPHAPKVFSHQCPACSAERQLRAIGKELGK